MITAPTKQGEIVWKSKTVKEDRYEVCPSCTQLVLDNWFMRHVAKCLATNPNRVNLMEEATRQHRNFKIDLLERTKDRLDEGVLYHHAKMPVTPPAPVTVEQVDAKLLSQTKTDVQMLTSFQKWTFKYGDLVEAIVTDIDKYNIVHVNMINGNPEKKGMIKNTKVRIGTVPDMHAHFKIGDKIRAEVNECRVDGKLWLSTKRFPIPTYPLPEKTPPALVKVEKNTPVKETVIVQPTLAAPAAPTIDDRHFEEVLTFVKSKIGIVSPEAKQKIKAMLDTKGMFTFMLALAKVADFQMDVGLMYAAEIEKQMGNQP